MLTRRLALALSVALCVLPTSIILSAQDSNRTSPPSRLILIDKRGNHIRFFDAANWKELGNISTGNQAGHEVAIAPDRRTAYVPIYGDGIINRNPNPGRVLLIVDLDTRQLRGTIDLSPCSAPHGVQVDSRGLVYVVCDISRTLLVVDPVARKVESTISIEGTGHWLTLLPDASKAYVSHQGGGEFISVVDLKTRKMVGRIPTASRGIVTSPDGQRVFAMTGGPTAPARVVVIDTNTDRIIDTVGLQGHSQPGYKLDVSPDGRTLITCGYESGGKVESMVNVLKTNDLHGPQKVMRAGRGTMGFAFSADSRTVFLANDGDGTVTVADVERGVVTNTFKGGTGIENLSYY